ncbi:hypothetical protein ACHAO4_009889 [Trichoderma viride]
MTPLQVAMQRKYGDFIQTLLAFKAYPEGIMGKEWRDAFRKRNEDVVQLSRGPDGEHYVDFPTTFPAGEELFQTSAGIQSCLYLLSDDSNSSFWSKIPSDVFAQSRLESNKLQMISKMANGHSVDISISLQLSLNSYLYDQPLGATGDNKRLDQMEFKGKNPEMIDFLAKYAQNLAKLRTILVEQTSAAETFIRDYCLHYNANHIPKSLLELLKNDIELGITKRIADLDQTVRDLLSIHFLSPVRVLRCTLGNPKYNRHKHKNTIRIDSSYCLFNYFSNYI